VNLLHLIGFIAIYQLINRKIKYSGKTLQILGALTPLWLYFFSHETQRHKDIARFVTCSD